MNKKYIWFGVVIIIVIFIGVYVSKKSNVPITSTFPLSANGVSTSTPTPQTVEIDVLSSGFVPMQVSIHSGDTVRFVNKDTAPHWPASDPHPTHTGYPGFDALHPVPPGQSYSFQFIRVGSFGFHDHLDPGLTGKVIVEASAASSQTTQSQTTIKNTPLSVGNVTWHQSNFVGKQVFLTGYVLKKEKGYVIFSDEATGAITVHDLPVTGAGTSNLALKQKYTFKGVFLDKGLVASNGSTYHLELSEVPQSVSSK